MWKAIDRQLWSVPVAIFGLTFAAVMALRGFSGVSFTFTNSPVRQQVYSSLAESSSALLGFLIAAVTILAAFGRKAATNPEEIRRENALAEARTRLVGLLLVVALLMLTLLITASVALSLSDRNDSLFIADTILVAGSFAGLVGLALGGIGLGLAVAERGKA
jgi:cytochrome b561